MPRQRSEIFSNPQNVYIGLDVHLKQWTVSIIQGGIQRKPFQQAPSATVLLSHLKKYYAGMNYCSAYEAGVCGCSIHYALEELGIHNIIFNAADISQTHKERVRKTDAVDAGKIARALAGGELSCVHIPPQWRLNDRNLIRLRSTQVSDLKRNKSRLRHYLHVNGITIPEEFASANWTKRFLEWLKKTARADKTFMGTTLAMMVENIATDMAERAKTDRLLVELMASDRYRSDYTLLRSIPGIGALTATTILLECGDLADFSSAEAFCAFVGLVPDSDQSDRHDVVCGITRRRHKALRYMLTECAWRAIRTDDHFSGLYAGYRRRMPAAKAIVKIAHKLAKIINFALKNKKTYVKPI